jgi:hypothetical protein
VGKAAGRQTALAPADFPYLTGKYREKIGSVLEQIEIDRQQIIIVQLLKNSIPGSTKPGIVRL